VGQAFSLLAIILTLIAPSCVHPPAPSYNQARAAYFHGEFPEVIRLATLGMERAPRQYWQFRLLKAEALLEQGKVRDALPLIESPGSLTGQLEVRRLIDDALARRSDPKTAFRLLDQAQARVTDNELQLQILQLQGILAFTPGKGDEAEAKVRQALALAIKTHADYYAARSLVSLGYFRKMNNRYSDAIDLNEEALAIARKLGAARVAAGALLNLTYLYAFFGDFERGVQDGKEAVAIFARIGDEQRYVNTIGDLAVSLNMQGQTQEAISWQKKGFDLARRRGDSSEAGRLAGNLALSYLDLADWDHAEQWNRLATPRNSYTVMNEADIALGRGQRDRFFQLSNEVIRTATTPALEWQVHSDMAAAYLKAQDYKNAFLEYQRALAAYEKARAQLPPGDIRRVTMLPRLIRTYQGYVDALIRDKKPDQAFALVESSRARVLEERFAEQPKTGTKPAALAPNTVLLSFWIAPRHSYLWLFSRSGNHLFDLPGEEEITPAVTDYKKLTEVDKKDPLGMSATWTSPLWSMLLEKAAPCIPPGSRVIVVPDGPLHQLNLETLVAPKPQPHYWLNDVEMVIAPSRALAPMFAGKSSINGKKMLLIGAADYSGTRYPRLRFAEEELNGIHAKLPQMEATTFEKAKATPQAYQASHPEQFAIIHFAAHAEANQEHPLQSAVLLSHSGDDYRLYAQDIYRIPIRADLVTVSACRSAGARAFAGEGLIGFAWAFLASGARHVIGGLWDVDDESTAQLMSELYAGIAAGADPVAALRRAKLKLIQDYKKPYYWAPLQVYAASR
jgi:tetratricopeptide (TPR) repeat protein